MQAAQATLRQSPAPSCPAQPEADASRTGYAEAKAGSKAQVEENAAMQAAQATLRQRLRYQMDAVSGIDASRTGYAEAKDVFQKRFLLDV